jgi:thioredoxin-related protein
MKRLICAFMLLPLLGQAQVSASINPLSAILVKASVPALSASRSTPGIQWVEGLSWEQLLQKAKNENKCIFLDCFTTWCGPCKMMDNNVYRDNSVGDYFNQRFISVKVQMDRTKHDNAFIQSWYNDADAINKQYEIEGYPSFIFLNPQGVMVHKEMGYREVKSFLGMAKTASLPGRVYINPDKEYDNFVAAFKDGIVQYDKLPAMTKIALKRNDTVMFNQITKSHVDHVSALNQKDRYTAENIQFWETFQLKSKTRLFNFFYNEGDLIDKVMKEKGYATAVVDKTIQDEIVIPFFNEENKSPVAMTGMYLNGPDLEKYNEEADWEKLGKMIRQKFNGVCAKRNVLNARIEWYERHRNFKAFAKYSFIKFRKYPRDLSKWYPAREVNHVSWAVFLYIKEKALVDKAAQWMKIMIKQYPRPISIFFDTYANLIYRLGKKEEAIVWEEKAINASAGTTAEGFKNVIEQMKRGERTPVKQ